MLINDVPSRSLTRTVRQRNPRRLGRGEPGHACGTDLNAYIWRVISRQRDFAHGYGVPN